MTSSMCPQVRLGTVEPRHHTVQIEQDESKGQWEWAAVKMTISDNGKECRPAGSSRTAGRCGSAGLGNISSNRTLVCSITSTSVPKYCPRRLGQHCFERKQTLDTPPAPTMPTLGNGYMVVHSPNGVFPLKLSHSHAQWGATSVTC